MIKSLVDKIKSSPEKWIFRILAATALLLRFEYLREFACEVHFPFAIGPDVQEYDERARELLRGIIFPAEPEIHAPLYSFFLAFWYKITNFSIGAVRAVQLLLNWAAFVALAELIRRLSKSWKLALIFLFFSLFTPVLFFHQAELISESLLAPLLAVFFWQIYFAKDDPRVFFSAGITLGLAVATHGLMLFFLAAEAGYFAVKKQWKKFFLLSAGAGIIIAGIIVVKSVHYQKFTPLQSNSFYNLWIGHNPEASGGCYLRSGQWRKTLERAKAEAAGRGISENRLFAGKIWTFYLNEPGKLLILPVRKLCLLLAPDEPVAGADSERLIRLTPVQCWGAGMMAAVLLSALAGIYFAWHRKETVFIHFYLLAGALSAGLLLTVVSGRYRQGMMPGILLFAALGAYHLGKKVWVIVVPAVCAGGLFITAAATLPWRIYPEASSIIGEAYFRQKKWDTAWLYLSSASSEINEPERFENMLGAIAEERNELFEAESRYRRAVNSVPDHPAGFLNLGHLYFYHFPERRSEALELISEALKRDPALPSAYDMLGQHAAQHGDISGALKRFETALAYEPENELYKKKVQACREILAQKRGKNAL